MSQSPFDATVSSPSTTEPAPDGAAPVSSTTASTRRRRHRSTGQRDTQRNESAAQPLANGDLPATATPVADTPTSTTPASSALTAPAPGEPTGKSPRANGTTAGGRRGGRRGARPRAPQLVPPAAESAAASESTQPPELAETSGPAVMAPDLAADVAADMLAAAGEAPATVPVVEQSSEDDDQAIQAHIETVTPAEVNQALHHLAPATPPAPRPRRYRFDRPATSAATPSVRPERLRATPIAPPAPEGGTTEPALLDVAAAPTAAAAPSADVPAAPSDAEQTLAPLSAEVAEAGGFEATGTPGAPESEEGAEVPSARRRRRRRRGSGNGTSIRHLEAVIAPDVAAPEPTPIASRLPGHSTATSLPYDQSPAPYATPPNELSGAEDQSTASAYSSTSQPYQLYRPDQPEPWNVADAYQQIGQPQSPFGAPEPSPARGFGPVPRGTAGSAPERSGRAARGERATDAPPISANQLATVVTQAIQSQTDRLLTELRHTQAPPSMTVMFPPFPSTERVGVFVDVANLLYSSRNMRISIDFGHLLEFLRGNRRLVRAQAYAPTSPEPHAEQQFLSVVKGVGYRITTKNYKTFSSGAKKADLDLDLCMDIVRLVDARALDTVVLVSGDSDFLPLLEYCSDHGVRVEVAAFDDSASTVLRQSCDLFINLSLVEDIRA